MVRLYLIFGGCLLLVACCGCSLRDTYDRLVQEGVALCDEAIEATRTDEAKEAATRERDSVAQLIERLKVLIETKQANISEQ